MNQERKTKGAINRCGGAVCNDGNKPKKKKKKKKRRRAQVKPDTSSQTDHHQPQRKTWWLRGDNGPFQPQTAQVIAAVVDEVFFFFFFFFLRAAFDASRGCANIPLLVSVSRPPRLPQPSTTNTKGSRSSPRLTTRRRPVAAKRANWEHALAHFRQNSTPLRRHQRFRCPPPLATASRGYPRSRRLKVVGNPLPTSDKQPGVKPRPQSRILPSPTNSFPPPRNTV